MRIVSRRQLQAFKKHKLALASSYILVLGICLSAMANLIANNRPIYMNFEGNHYFPVFQNLTAKDFGQSGIQLEADFRALTSERQESVGFVVWPLIRWHPNESDRSVHRPPSAPDSQHWMGTDNRGRDIAARLIYGLRNSLLYAVFVWFFSYTIGIILGGIQGFWGGRVDFLVQRVIEVLVALPSFFLLIIISSIFRPNLVLLAVFTVLVGGWIPISYYVRAEFLKLRNFEFVEAAKAQGLGTLRIVFRHILPNALTPVITFTPFALTGAITSLAGLDFLGFGLSPPTASWGELLSQALKHFDHAWWLAVFPVVMIVVTLLVLNFIGEGLRQALDPRSGS